MEGTIGKLHFSVLLLLCCATWTYQAVIEEKLPEVKLDSAPALIPTVVTNPDPVVIDEPIDQLSGVVVPTLNRQQRTFWPFTSLFGYDYYDYGYPAPPPPPMMGGPGFRPGFGMGPPPPTPYFGGGMGFQLGM